MRLTEQEQAVLDGIRRHPEGITIRALSAEDEAIGCLDYRVRRAILQRLHWRGFIVRHTAVRSNSHVVWRAK